MVAALGLLTSCDPSKDSISMPGNSDLTGEQLASGFSVEQFADEDYTTPAADGNYFKFTTSPSRVVTIFQKDEDGGRNVLASGTANGKFKIVPKRGNPSEQTYYIETRDFNGNLIEGQKTATVYVPQELEPAIRWLASDAYGSKTWKWDTEFREDGAVWGNMGYAAGSGDSWIVNGDGIWWGCGPEELAASQLGHSDTGVATGEESKDATMVFFDDGNIICYDAGGNQIRKGKYSVSGWTGTRSHPSADGSQAEWSMGTLTTTAGSILWPFQINTHNLSDGHWDATTCPTNFEIMQLDANHLKLVYPQTGTGGWSEATWWAFKSASDPEAALTGFDNKAWTWDTESWEGQWFAGAGWGNMGYAAGSGESWIVNGDGIWWGCGSAELAASQLGHSDTGVATGEEDPAAYMTFDWKTGVIKKYNASGAEIKSGKFEISEWNNGNRLPSADGSQAEWKLGTLNTDAGSILWPFQINTHNISTDHWDATTCPTTFEVMQLDEDHMKLVYPQSGTGGWSEATWWAFKKK